MMKIQIDIKPAEFLRAENDYANISRKWRKK